MLLNAAEAGLAQAFAFLFSTIYPRELAGKRIMTTNLAQCISGAFGGLFAYAIQTMDLGMALPLGDGSLSSNSVSPS
jgi:hypothetical protein